MLTVLSVLKGVLIVSLMVLLDEVIIFLDFQADLYWNSRGSVDAVSSSSLTRSTHAEDRMEQVFPGIPSSNFENKIHTATISFSGFFGDGIYRDIPDLDPGRIPYVSDTKGRCAIGERNTAIVIRLQSYSTEEIKATLDSLVSHLLAPSTRVYVNLILFEWKSTHSFSIDPWSSKLKNTPFTITNRFMEDLHKHQIKQVLFIVKPCLISLDILEFFAATSYILWNDPSLYVVEAWNPFSTSKFTLNEYGVMRVDVPSAAVFLVTMELIDTHKQHIDLFDEAEWIVKPDVRKGRFCINPVLSRVKVLSRIQIPFLTFSNRNVHTAKQFVPFLEMDCRYLYQANYENELVNTLKQSRLVQNVSDVIEGNLGDVYRVEYSEEKSLESIVKQLEVDTFASGGSFPWVYRGVAHFVIEGVHLYITCHNVFPCDSYPFSFCFVCFICISRGNDIAWRVPLQIVFLLYTFHLISHYSSLKCCLWNF